MIKPSGAGYKVFHCHGGSGAVKATPHPVSYQKALSIHKAIEVSKHGSPYQKAVNRAK
jgi:hypothetical protein